MASKPISIEIRAYQVGFGDCFLVSFVYAKNQKRHLLVDFGTTGLPKRKGVTPKSYMPRVAAAIRRDCGGQLTAVIATHRHADHISGFATDSKSGASGAIIAACKPKLVLQPWTEDPKAAKNAKRATKTSTASEKRFVASLGAMHDIAAAVDKIAQNPPRSMSAATVQQLSFLGMDNIKNKSAVDNLIKMGSGGRAVWARHGSRSGLEKLLPGVKVHVLGPPDLTQTEKIKKMRSSDPTQFWQLLGGPMALRGLGVAGNGAATASLPSAKGTLPAEARWFCAKLATMSGEQLLEIVRILDDQMNNTSLILLFEVGGKKLLFPGDAQIENWSYALEDAPSAAATRKLLRNVDFYKVGHHGSRNATPKALLWDNFAKRGKTKGKRLATALSTMPGKHGKSAKRTEVPRKTLLDALHEESDLEDTHDLPAPSLTKPVPFTLQTIKV